MVDEGFLVRTGTLQGFADECAARGVDAVELIAEVGLHPEILRNPELYIHRHKNVALLSLAAERTGCPTFGLELAIRQDQDVLGALLHLMSRAATVGEALDMASQFLTYHVRGANFSHRQLDAERSVAELELGLEPTPKTRTSADLTIVHLTAIIERLCGDGVDVDEVWMMHPEPADPGPYRRHFATAIRWDQPVLGVVFPTAALSRPPASVPDIKAFLLQYVEEVSAPLETKDIGGQTRAVLRSLIGRSATTIEVVAAAMSMHVRELQRELRELGLGFRELRDEVHLEHACTELRRPNLVINDLAIALGYSDGSAFSRAFKRWTGKTPTAWRSEAIEGSW